MYNKEKNGWILDYSWGSEINNWKECSDVLLEGKILSNDIQNLDFLKSIISEFNKGYASLDGEKKEIFYSGGIQGYIKKNKKTVSIYLHSSGEDAFDSLSYYSELIERKLREKNKKVFFKWIEHKHNRNKNILKLIN